jgi:hypothetical protein
VYSIQIDADVSEQIEALPASALPAYAELMAILEIAPRSGDAFNRNSPDRNMRVKTFGGDAN